MHCISAMHIRNSLIQLLSAFTNFRRLLITLNLDRVLDILDSIAISLATVFGRFNLG